MQYKKVFIDTSGFYALLVSNDDYHMTARNFINNAREQKILLHTTDYILDETYTLLKARKVSSQIQVLMELLSKSKAIKINWIDQEIFDLGSKFFLKHEDQDYSFTDCLSFVMMKKLGIKLVLTKDHHFANASFEII